MTIIVTMRYFSFLYREPRFRLRPEVGIFGKLARSRLAQLANASQLSDLFFSSLANTSQLGGLRLSLLAVGGAERAMRARHF